MQGGVGHNESGGVKPGDMFVYELPAKLPKYDKKLPFVFYYSLWGI